MDFLPRTRVIRTVKATANANDGIGRGMEFAILVLMFLGVGYVLDRWLDTKPVFMILFVVLGLVGQFASMWYGYEARMRELESERRDAAHQGRASVR
ncbi:unannotated protein [freshwater metagenome]|uniref:Unannotated protein n=1 Tax=freshwater metagenome TaxID=449393 RepID=A0A6J7F4J4_9ZZZZ|nr:hypothetical protein [Actinomycetota bacterium]